MQPGAHNEMNELSRTGGGIGIKLPFLPLLHLLISAQTVKFIWVKKTLIRYTSIRTEECILLRACVGLQQFKELYRDSLYILLPSNNLVLRKSSILAVTDHLWWIVAGKSFTEACWLGRIQFSEAQWTFHRNLFKAIVFEVLYYSLNVTVKM